MLIDAGAGGDEADGKAPAGSTSSPGRVSRPEAGGEAGTVYETGGGVYRVALDGGGIVHASLRGRLKLQERTGDQVVVGDRVRVAREGQDAFAIDEVLPRKGELVRRSGAGGRRVRVVAANVDRMLVVVAAANPEPRATLIDRLLVLGEASGLECFLMINKVDLPEASKARALGELYRGVGYPAFETSCALGLGLDAVQAVLGSGTTVLVGPSGAGKSSLLNALQPDLGLRTGELSRKRGTGRHTTVGSRLIPLRSGGLVADTPGFADAGIWNVSAEEMGDCFPEFRPFLGGCRFRGCSHLHEPDCAVRGALEEGKIAASRYESYVATYQESVRISRH